MVDYNAALPQLAQFQAPNVLAMASQANQMQAANMLMQQRAQELQKENALRVAGAKFGVNTPEYAAAAGGIDPEAGLKAYHYQSQIVNQQRQALGEARRARLAEIQSDEKLMDLASKHGEEFKNGVRMIEGFPEQERPAAWGRLISALPEKMRAVYPSAYSTDAARLAMSTTSEILSAAKPKESQYLMGPAGPIAIDKNTGTYSVVPEGGAARAVDVPAAAPAAGVLAAAAAGAPFAAPANTPAAVMRQPTAAGSPAIGDAFSQRLNAAEGVDKNSRSTARGFGQFINGTFVDTAKKVFPELANKSPAEILTLRGTKLADGTPIEAVLEQKFRTDNIASLTSAGIQPTPGNVYLAHFLGAGGARNVLSADPNTPLSQVVSADAIEANPEVLAIRNKTVGDLQNWANSKFGGEPGLAASMTAGNARLGGAPTGFAPAGGAPMSLGAPTVTNALMLGLPGAAASPPQNAMLSLQPQIAGALTPPAAAPVAAAAVAPTAPVQPPLGGMAGQRATIAQEKLAEKGAEQRQTIQINKDASEAEKVVIREGFDKVWANIISQFKKLGANQMLIVPGETSLGNRAKAIGSTLSPTLTTLVAPERAAPVTTLSNVNQTMLSALMGASGLTAQQLNSNKEMSAYLASLSNPGQPVESIVDTLNNLSERFGTGQKITAKDLTGGKAQNPMSGKVAPATNIHDAADAILRGGIK
jgi:hypothetical protein